MLYACYDLIPLHKVMELSWRHNLSDFTMPFMINYMSQQASMIDTLRRDNEERKARETSTSKPEDDGPILGQSRLLLTQAPVQSSGRARLPVDPERQFGATPGRRCGYPRRQRHPPRRAQRICKAHTRLRPAKLPARLDAGAAAPRDAPDAASPA